MPLASPTTYADYRQLFAGCALPLAYVDLDRLEANGQAMAERARHLPIRVATKSIRSVGILRHILEQIPGIQGLMCYNAAEAAYLASQGFVDLLIAYPTLDQNAIRACGDAVRRGTRITFMVDCTEHLALLQQAAQAQDLSLRVCFDLDVSESLPGLHFGVQRSPLRTTDAVLALYRQLAQHDRLQLVGLMAYEAQIAGVPDNAPHQTARNQIIRGLKAYSLPRIARRREAAVTALTQAGARLEFVNGGGTGSLQTTSREAVITEVAAGSGFFAPHQFDHYQAFRLQPAAGFALPVVRIPEPGLVTCAGGGYIASGPAAPEKMPQVFLPDDGRLLATEGAGEVQTPVRTSQPLQVGDPVFFRHAKAGELCEHFQQLWLIRGGQIIGSASTYRGDGQCFL